MVPGRKDTSINLQLLLLSLLIVFTRLFWYRHRTHIFGLWLAWSRVWMRSRVRLWLWCWRWYGLGTSWRFKVILVGNGRQLFGNLLVQFLFLKFGPLMERFVYNVQWRDGILFVRLSEDMFTIWKSRPKTVELARHRNVSNDYSKCEKKSRWRHR